MSYYEKCLARIENATEIEIAASLHSAAYETNCGLEVRSSYAETYLSVSFNGTSVPLSKEEMKLLAEAAEKKYTKLYKQKTAKALKDL